LQNNLPPSIAKDDLCCLTGVTYKYFHKDILLEDAYSVREKEYGMVTPFEKSNKFFGNPEMLLGIIFLIIPKLKN
jgi:hypothetical protein